MRTKTQQLTLSTYLLLGPASSGFADALPASTRMVGGSEINISALPADTGGPVLKSAGAGASGVMLPLLAQLV